MKKQFLTLLTLAVMCCMSQRTWAEDDMCAFLLGKTNSTSGQYVPAYLKWETDADGNVNITIYPYNAAEETADKPTRWRGRGMADDLTAAKGWGMTINGESAVLSEYFTKNYTSNGTQSKAPTVYQLKINNGKKEELSGKNVVITFSKNAPSYICWWTPRGNNAYAKYDMTYTYGTTCQMDELLPPTNVVISGNTITFTEAENATGYIANIYVGDTKVVAQAVTSGATLVEPILSAMNYSVKVKSMGNGGAESEESDGVQWETTDRSKQKEELGGSEYCDYVIGNAGEQAAMDWQTDEDGNINIDIKIVDGTQTTWRSTAFKGVANFKVGSVPASVFFEENYTTGSTCYQLKKKQGVTLGWGETINFTGDVQWSVFTDKSHGPYILNTSYAYTYGAGCASLAKPVITDVDANKVITFEPVENAETYEATVMFGSTVVLKQNVVSGDALNFIPYADGNYSVTLVAMAEGMANSEPSDSKVLSLTAAPFTPAASEICIYRMQSAQETDTTHNVAYLSAETDEQGRIVFTIKGEAGCAFRGNSPLDMNKMQIGGTTAATFFTSSVVGATYTLTPKTGSGIGYGAVINFKGSISWQTDGWQNSYVENKTLVFTYGNTGCTDEAPELVASADALDLTSVRVSMTATDDHNLPITYTIQREGKEDITLNGESGVQVYYDFTGLTTNTTYYYTVFATDGFNPTEPQQLSATPAGDVEAPTNVQLILKPLTLTDAKLIVSADDNYPGDLTFTITGEGISGPLVGAPSTPVVQYLTGLTAGETYNYSVIVTDAAGNSTEQPVEATLTMFSENILLNKPATAGSTEGGHDAALAVDGSVTTYWGNYGKVNYADHNNWLSVNCNGIYEVSSVTITWSHFPDYAGFMLQVRNGAEDWQTVLTYTGDKYSKGEVQMIEFETPIQLSDIRVFSEGATNTWYMAIYELAAFGTAMADTEAPQNLSLTGVPFSEEALQITMYATDNSFGSLTYTVYVDGVAQANTITLPQATDAVYMLEGLNPGQTYEVYFKVADVSGNSSTSSSISLTTMTAAGNIAYHKLATAGSEEGAHGAAYAVDGDNNTYWGNYGKPTFEEHNNWLAVDLCGIYAVERVTIKWQHFPEYAGFVLQIRNGEGDWQTVFTHEGDNYQGGQTQIIDLATPTPATDIRVFSEGATNTWYMAIYELKAFGEGAVMLDDHADNAAKIAAMEGLTTDVALNRNFVPDTKYTLCVPFAMNEEQIADAFGSNAQVYDLTDAYIKGNLTLYLGFSNVSTIEAGTPYIIVPSSVYEANTVIEGVTLSSATQTRGNSLATFYGVTSATELAAGKFVLNSADSYLYETAAGTLYGMRGYFELNLTPEQKIAVRSFRAVFNHSDVVTNLGEVDDTQCTMRNGKYVINGKFFIIHDDKTYNAQGQVAGCR